MKFQRKHSKKSSGKIRWAQTHIMGKMTFLGTSVWVGKLTTGFPIRDILSLPNGWVFLCTHFPHYSVTLEALISFNLMRYLERTRMVVPRDTFTSLRRIPCLRDSQRSVNAMGYIATKFTKKRTTSFVSNSPVTSMAEVRPFRLNFFFAEWPTKVTRGNSAWSRIAHPICGRTMFVSIFKYSGINVSGVLGYSHPTNYH